MDARRVLIAWIVVTQLLAFPFVAFGALMGLVAVPLRLEHWLPVLMILVLSLLIEGGIAFLCGSALRERLRSRLSYSPLVVALASSMGLLAATLLGGALAMALLRDGSVAVEPLVLIPVGAACLGFGSGLGTLIGCRYRPG
jgi:hypothetical protein